MKRERRPPKTWRRNMLAGAALLAVLDGTILSAGLTEIREVFALAITVFVGGFIVAVWRSNSRLEKMTDDPEKGAQGKGKAGRS